MTYEEVLARFTVKQRSRDKAKAICPCHEDKNPSLTITRGDKHPAVLHCAAGCDTADILAAVGLNMGDIMSEDGQPQKEPETWKAYIEKREGKKLVAAYDYCDLSGDYVYTKIRLEPKAFVYGRLSAGRFSYGLGGKSRKSIPAFFCPDRAAFESAVKAKKIVCCVEGEKDTLTLWQHGFPAVTCGGAGDWLPECAEIFRGADVVILADNDDAGRKSANGIARDLEEIAAVTRVITPMPDLEHGDVSDFFAEHSAGEFVSLLKKDFHLVSKGKVTGAFDYAIFKHISKREKILVIGGIPYLYEDGVFKQDLSGAKLKSMIADLLYPKFVKAPTVKRIFDLFIMSAELQADPESMNRYPESWICFKNGMYDVIEKRMRPHSPEYRALNQIPHDFCPDSVEKNQTVADWLQFITEGKPDNLEMLLEYAGYCLTRDTRQQKFLILCGEGGTGKSLFIRLLGDVVGSENTSNISLSELSQRFSSFGLLGKLLNSCADLEISALEDTSTLKKVLGEDVIRAEAKGRDAFSFRSVAKLIFSTNELPVVKAEKTNGFYRRLLVLPVNRQPDERRHDFYAELQEGLPYFIREAVGALGRMYEKGVILESEDSKEAVRQLRSDSDTVEAFLQEEAERGAGLREVKTKLFPAYEEWCRKAERQSLTKSNFYKALRVKGFSELKTGGVRFIKGVSLGKIAPDSAPELPLEGFLPVPKGEDVVFD